MIAQTGPSGPEAVALFVPLAVFVLLLVGWVKIITKAGFSGWWVLIAFVPIVNIVMFFVFAFSDWPALAGSRPPAASRPPDDRGFEGGAALPPPPPAP